MKNKKYRSIVALGTLAMTFALAVPAFAETNINEGANINVGAGLNSWNGKGMGQINNHPGIFGTVTAVNSGTITLSTKAGPSGQPVATTYTVSTTATTTVVKNNV